MNIMKPIKSIANNRRFAEITQTTATAVAIETTLKAIGRPTFTLLDSHADKNTKKYSASKEFLYQSLCLGLYLTVIPLFKKGGFKAFKKIFKNKEGFSKFKNYTEFSKYRQKAKMDKTLDSYPLIKGAIELSSIVGSVATLTVLAPQIVHHTLKPIMDFLGIKFDNTKSQNVEQSKIENLEDKNKKIFKAFI